MNSFFRTARICSGTIYKRKPEVPISGTNTFSSSCNQGEPVIRRIPNTGHSIQGYQETLRSFYLSIADVSRDAPGMCCLIVRSRNKVSRR